MCDKCRTAALYRKAAFHIMEDAREQYEKARSDWQEARKEHLSIQSDCVGGGCERNKHKCDLPVGFLHEDAEEWVCPVCGQKYSFQLDESTGWWVKEGGA